MERAGLASICTAVDPVLDGSEAFLSHREEVNAVEDQTPCSSMERNHASTSRVKKRTDLGPPSMKISSKGTEEPDQGETKEAKTGS